MKRKKLAIELGMICLSISVAASVSAATGDQEVAPAATEQPSAQTTQTSDAPTAPISDKQKIAQIVVTAQKRSQAINKVGLPIAAFSGDQLKDNGVSNASDLGVMTPGLTVSETQPTGVPVYTLRGVGFADYATSSSSTVGLYLDEVSIPYAVMSNGVLFDLERVEVLKGPQGDLYGRNTTAGQINFISARPTRNFRSGVSLDFGSFGVLDAEGFASGAITDSVLGRVAVKTSQTLGNDGWQKSVSRPDDHLGKHDSLGLRSLFNWQINDRATAFFNLHYNRDKSDNVAPTAYDGRINGEHTQAQYLSSVLPAAPYFSVGDNRAAEWSPTFRPQRNNELQGASAKVDWDLSDSLTLTSITAFDKFNRDDRYETDGVAFQAGNTRNASNIDVFSQELRLTSKDGNNPLSWIGGLYYSHDKLSEDYDYLFKDSFYGTALGINKIHTHYEQKTNSIAAFGHAELALNDRFKLIGGTRYTYEKREWSGCTYDYGDGTLSNAWNNILTPYTILSNNFPDPGKISAGNCAVYDDIAGSPNYGKFAVFNDQISTGRWQGKLGLDYQADKNTLYFFNVSQGFKSGGFNGAAAQTQSQLKPYKYETLTAFEAGFKATLFDQRAQLNASVFHYDYRDKQEKTIAVTPVGNIGGLTNIPKSRVNGAEVELMANLGGGFSQSANIAYLSTNVIEYMAISNNSQYPNVIRVNAAGQNLPNAPRWQVSETTTYEQNISNGQRVWAAAEVNFKSAAEGSSQDRLQAYGLLNLRLGIGAQSKKWSATLYGRNVLNKYYYTAAISGNTTYARINGMPRTLGVMYNYLF
ncbi:MAG: TonB-dependent receptor [Proteobacteria bacterium]|nr:TonB-dependent receptor [Pseudomonadota bacterium]